MSSSVSDPVFQAIIGSMDASSGSTVDHFTHFEAFLRRCGDPEMVNKLTGSPAGHELLNTLLQQIRYSLANRFRKPLPDSLVEAMSLFVCQYFQK